MVLGHSSNQDFCAFEFSLLFISLFNLFFWCRIAKLMWKGKKPHYYFPHFFNICDTLCIINVIPMLMHLLLNFTALQLHSGAIETIAVLWKASLIHHQIFNAGLIEILLHKFGFGVLVLKYTLRFLENEFFPILRLNVSHVSVSSQP